MVALETFGNFLYSDSNLFDMVRRRSKVVGNFISFVVEAVFELTTNPIKREVYPTQVVFSLAKSRLNG